MSQAQRLKALEDKNPPAEDARGELSLHGQA